MTQTIIEVQLDGTLCTVEPRERYKFAEPFPERIKLVNELKEQGFWISIVTSRSYITKNARDKDGIDRLTLEQLAKWGVKYSSCMTERMPADIIISNKAIEIDGKENWLFQITERIGGE